MSIFKNLATYFCVMAISHTVAMDQNQITAQQYGTLLAPLLPQLTILPESFVYYGMPNRTQSIEVKNQIDYQDALAHPDSLQALECLLREHESSAANTLTRVELIEGRACTKKSRMAFPLVSLAYAITLLEAQGHTAQVDRALGQAIDLSNILRSHEEPIVFASQALQHWLKGEYEQSLTSLLALQKLAKIYTCWQPIVAMHAKVLENVGFSPAVQLCAQEGDVQRALHMRDEHLALQKLQSTCHMLSGQLVSKNKKIKNKALQEAESLVRTCLSDDTAARKLAQFGLLSTLEDLAKAQHPAVVGFYTEFACKQALMQEVVDVARYKQIKQWAQGALTAQKDDPVLQEIFNFSRAMLATVHDRSAAAIAFIDLLQEPETIGVCSNAIRIYAAKYLDEFAAHGVHEAVAYKAQLMIHAEKDALSEETVTFCLAGAENFLASPAPSQSDTLLRFHLVLQTIARAQKDNAQAQYLASRLLFRFLHKDTQHLTLDQQAPLTTCIMHAMCAVKGGLQEKYPFLKATMLYRGLIGLVAQIDELKRNGSADTVIDEKKNVIVAQLLDLLGLKLPSVEMTLCAQFAQHHLTHLAADGHQMAGAWLLRQKLAVGADTDVHYVVAVCQRVFKGMLERVTVEPRALSMALEPFSRFDIVRQLEKIHSHKKYPEYAHEIVAALAYAYMLQSQISFTFVDAVGYDQLCSLKKAYTYSKQLLQPTLRKVNAEYKQLFCNICYRLGHLLIAAGNNEEAIEYLNEGSCLQDPACMRASALFALEQQPADGVQIPVGIFSALINTLERAYRLGDTCAGAVLAQHYFDGSLEPFGCGHSLEKDIKRGIELAKEIGPEYPQTARLLGYLEYYKLTHDVNNKNKRIDFSRAVNLLLRAADGGQRAAFDLLEDIATSPIVTEQVGQQIIDYLQTEKVMQIPEGLCALAGILLRGKDMRVFDTAISYYEKAAQLSNGRLGYLELAKLFVTYERNGKRDAIRAAECCVRMLESPAYQEHAPAELGSVITLVYSALDKHDELGDRREEAQKLQARMSELLSRVGVKIVLEKMYEKYEKN